MKFEIFGNGKWHVIDDVDIHSYLEKEFPIGFQDKINALNITGKYVVNVNNKELQCLFSNNFDNFFKDCPIDKIAETIEEYYVENELYELTYEEIITYLTFYNIKDYHKDLVDIEDANYGDTLDYFMDEELKRLELYDKLPNFYKSILTGYVNDSDTKRLEKGYYRFNYFYNEEFDKVVTHYSDEVKTRKPWWL